MGNGKKQNTQFSKHSPSYPTECLALAVANKVATHSDDVKEYIKLANLKTGMDLGKN